MLRRMCHLPSVEDRIKFLNLFSSFSGQMDSVSSECVFRFEIKSKGLTEILYQYPELKEMGSDNEMKYFINLLKWTSRQLVGDGMCVPPERIDALYILSKTKSERIKSNCWMYSTVLNEILLALGFASRVVRCMPLEADFHDCHCMTEVWSSQNNKWVALDSANRAVYLSRKGVPLNVYEIREHIRSQNEFLVPYMDRKTRNELANYLATNMLRFESWRISCFGEESKESAEMIEFLPTNYYLSEKDVQIGGKTIHYTAVHSPDIFWASPEKNSFIAEG